MENNNKVIIGELYFQQIDNTDECKLGIELFINEDKFTSRDLDKMERYLSLINEIICKTINK